MKPVVTMIVPDHALIPEELRRLADKIESGEQQATTLLVISRDKTERAISTQVCGEAIEYSSLMGMCAYASNQMYRRANDEI